MAKHVPLKDSTCMYCGKGVLSGTPVVDEDCPKSPKGHPPRPMVSAMEDIDAIHARIKELQAEQAAEWAKPAA